MWTKCCVTDASVLPYSRQVRTGEHRETGMPRGHGWNCHYECVWRSLATDHSL